MTETIPDVVLRARQMYVAGAPTKDIVAATGLSKGTLYHWLAGAGALPPIPLRRRPHRKRGRAALIRRIMRAAEVQVRQIGKRLAEEGVAPDERDRQLRSFAVLSRTMRELIALEMADAQVQKMTTAQDDDEQLPRDIDELRAELARRIEGIRRGDARRT